MESTDTNLKIRELANVVNETRSGQVKGAPGREAFLDRRGEKGFGLGEVFYPLREDHLAI